jgi:dienelactone hydrolase
VRISLLRFLACLPLPGVLLLLLLDPAILRIVLPFREVILVLCSVQILWSAIIVLKARRGGRTVPLHSGAILVAAICAAYVLIAEFDINQQNVSFQSNGARLAGTLYRGKTAGEHPAIVVVHGSGKFPRRLYRYWAQKLAAMGFDVLVYDKRGVGDSGGVYEGENNTSTGNVTTLAEDASNAVDFLASLPGTTRHVGLFGVSQGGWVATLTAQMNPRVKFLVMHSGPVVSVGQQNLYERLTGAGHSSSSLSLTDAERKSQAVTRDGFDPRPILAKLDVTALWLYGTSDKNVPVQTSVKNLKDLIASGKTYEYREFPGADHLILTRSTRFSRLPDEYWNSIANWARKHENRQLDARLVH